MVYLVVRFCGEKYKYERLYLVVIYNENVQNLVFGFAFSRNYDFKTEEKTCFQITDHGVIFLNCLKIAFSQYNFFIAITLFTYFTKCLIAFLKNFKS